MRRSLTILPAALLGAGLSPAPGFAQPAAVDWECAAERCTAREPVEFARITRTFRHGARIDSKAEADRVASLEQQSLREFEFAINEPALIYADLDVDATPPGDWPADLTIPPIRTLLMWRSADGDNFASIGQGAAVQPGDTLLVAVPQSVEGFGEAQVSYFPGRFTVTLTARRIRAADAGAVGDIALPPLLIHADTDLPDDSDDPPVATLSVTGRPDSTPAPAPPPDDPAPGGDAVAAELQGELARHGCYTAAIDGLWGPGSRAAMRAFNTATGQAHVVQGPTASALAAAARLADPACRAD